MNLKQNVLSHILNNLFNKINYSFSLDGKCIRTLKLLPYLMTPVAITRKWKPSKLEVDEAFIIHVKVNLTKLDVLSLFFLILMYSKISFRS